MSRNFWVVVVLLISLLIQCAVAIGNTIEANMWSQSEVCKEVSFHFSCPVDSLVSDSIILSASIFLTFCLVAVFARGE